MSESRTDFGKWWDEHADDKWASEVDIFDRVGLCTVNGYDEEGFVGSWSIRTTRDIDRLPGSLLYEVAK